MSDTKDNLNVEGRAQVRRRLGRPAPEGAEGIPPELLARCVTRSDIVAVREGCYFDERKSRQNVAWMEDRFNIKFYKWQKDLLERYFGWRRKDGSYRFRRVQCWIPKKNGKALALGTLIPTPKGFQRLADIHSGDTVFDEQGCPCRVVAETPIQINRPCYEVEFSDGRVIVADAEHEWVTSSYLDSGQKVQRCITTREIKHTLQYTKEAKRHAIHVAAPVRYRENDSELLIDPYVLGLWLGDGTASNHHLTLAWKDQEVLNYVVKAGYNHGEVKQRMDGQHEGKLKALCVALGTVLHDQPQPRGMSGATLKQDLRALDLLSVVKEPTKKHIPKKYLRASVSQRFALLQGLMDTDGSISPAGQCTFTSTTKALFKGFCQLARSLGFKITTRHRDPVIRHKGRWVACARSYEACFYAYQDTPVFRLRRKLTRQKARPEKDTRTSYFKIVDVRPTASVPVKCIQVDSPSHQYLASKSFIPTHNSYLMAALLGYKLFESSKPFSRLYSMACNAGQAKIVMEELVKIWRRSRKMRALMRGGRRAKVKAFVSPFRREVTNSITGSRYQALADVGEANDGLIPDVLVFDEIHRMKNEKIDIVDGSTSNMPHALKIVVSTAGSGDKLHRSWQNYDYCKKVLDGEIVDTQLLCIVYEHPNPTDLIGEEIYDINQLLLCNPVLQEDMEKRAEATRECNEAKVKRNDTWWRRFRLNQWISTDGDIYINNDQWTAACDAEVRLIDWQKCKCYVGIDKSGTVSDFIAITLLFRMADGRLWQRDYTFVVADAIKAMSEVDDVDYESLAAKELHVIPTEAVVDDWLTAWLKEELRQYDVRKVGADPYLAQHQIESLTAAGYEVVHITQSNNRLLTPVIEDYEARVRQKRLLHGPNVLMDWQVGCTRVFSTSKDTKKLVKMNSNLRGKGGIGHIDNIDAAINALAVLRVEEIDEAANGQNSGGITE